MACPGCLSSLVSALSGAALPQVVGYKESKMMDGSKPNDMDMNRSTADINISKSVVSLLIH